MAVATQPPRGELARIGRSVGYLIGAGINVVLMFIVANLLDWGVPTFLTGEFSQVEPLVVFSLGITALANVVYAMADMTIVRRAGDVIKGSISVLVTARLLAVFPFDFSRYEFNWEAVARGFLIFVLVATIISVLFNLVRLGRAAGQVTTSAKPGPRGRSS